MLEVIDTKKCVGCRSCEISCSYHHQKRFWPAISSIEVKRQEKAGKFGIVIHYQNAGERIACDGCGFCLEFCPAETRNELRDILEKKTSYGKGVKVR
jgi:ferredoxin